MYWWSAHYLSDGRQHTAGEGVAPTLKAAIIAAYKAVESLDVEGATVTVKAGKKHISRSAR